jgi:pimeloyl-ACP methyl ester carboxylesterase
LIYGLVVAATVTVNGVRLSYVDWNASGSGSAKPPVLMVHGLSSQGHTWDPVAAVLAQDRRVLTPDLRGHGDSSWAEDGYDLLRFVEDLLAFTAALGLDRIDYVGQSFGGQVGIALAGEQPGLVRRLVVNDMLPEMAAASVGQTRAQVSGAEVKGFSSVDAAATHYRELYPEWRDDFVRLFAEHQLRRNWAGKYVPKADPDLFWLLGSAGRKRVSYLWEMAERITADVLVFWCRRSEVLAPETVERFTATVPSVTVEEVDAGHFFPREDPDGFTARTVRFLDG